MEGASASCTFRFGGNRRSRHILLGFFSLVRRLDDSRLVEHGMGGAELVLCSLIGEHLVE